MGFITDEVERKMAEHDRWLNEEAMPEQREAYMRVESLWPREVRWGAKHPEIQKRRDAVSEWHRCLRMIRYHWGVYSGEQMQR